MAETVATASATRGNPILALLNLVTLLLSIPVLVVGIWLAKRHHADCLGFLQWPIIAIGIIMFVVSLIGLMGSLKRSALLLWVYLVLLLLVFLLLLAFTAFAFAVTRGGNGHKIPGGNFKEYRLSDDSPWLRNRVNSIRNWEKIKRCLRDGGVCSNFHIDYPTKTDLYRSKVSYVESGCCKPPVACGFKFVNATNWVDATNPLADVDCSRWSDKPTELCYDCNSCRAGVLRTVKKDWRKVAKVNIAVLAVLIVVYFMTWAAFLNAVRQGTLISTAPRRRPAPAYGHP